MSSFHDQIFSEIDAARKLAADFANRYRGHQARSPRLPSAAERLAQEEAAAAEIAALLVEEERMADETREQVDHREKEWSEEGSKTDAAREDGSVLKKKEFRWNAMAILQGLGRLRAEERSAAEELIRKAHEFRDKPAPRTTGHEADERERSPELPATPILGMWAPSLGASQVWYFTSWGTRCGPVTFKELRTIAANRVLDPRLDMVWKEGMDGWKQAGLLDGLFERRTVYAETPDRRGSKKLWRLAALPTYLTAALASKNMCWPGVGRWPLWCGLLLFPILWSHLLWWSSPTLVATLGSALMSRFLPFAGFVPVAALTYLVLMRLVNVGMSRWWALVLAIPVLNLWVGFRCLACPAGYAYHRKMDRAGMASAFAVVVIVPAVWYIHSRHPDLLSPVQLQTVLRHLVEGAGMIISPG